MVILFFSTEEFLKTTLSDRFRISARYNERRLFLRRLNKFMLLTENKISAVCAKAPVEHSQMAFPEPGATWRILRSAALPKGKQGLKCQTLKSDKANSSIHLRIASA